MKQTTVREIAYHETYEWLMNDKEGAKPTVPIGMHDMAVSEWEAGHKEALSAFDADDDWFDLVIDVTICTIKVAILYGLFSIGSYIDTWWGYIASFFVTFMFVWKFLTGSRRE